MVGIEGKENIFKAIKEHCNIKIEKEHFIVGSFISVSDDVIRAYIEDEDDHKTVLYARTLPQLIKALQDLEKKLNKEFSVNLGGGNKDGDK